MSAEPDLPLPRIRVAGARSGRSLHVIWADGREQTIDVSAALNSRRLFLRLRDDDALFATAGVNDDGNAVQWADGAELSALWIDRLAKVQLDNAGFREAMEELAVSLDGMAAELGIARRLVAGYRKDVPIPKTVALAVRYLVDLQRRAV